MKKKPGFAGTVIHVSVAAIAREQGQIFVEIGLYLPAELAVTYSPRVGECLLLGHYCISLDYLTL
jgi:hypothetical protein